MGRRAVAIGGGTGLPLVLTCLLRGGFDTTAVVTMADDGGSSGHLRRELGILPPGDIRNCLVALAEPGNDLARLFQYRFTTGAGLAGHALGNLIIAALADLDGGFAEAVEHAGRLLGSRGRVLPSTTADVRLSAHDAAGNVVAGQANVASSEGPVRTVCLEPEHAPGYPPAVAAITEADLVVIGPGSLFTSLIPNFLVAEVAAAMRQTSAKTVYVCNVANQRGETTGMDAADHVLALHAHGLEGCLDIVLVNGEPLPEGMPAVGAGPEVLERIERLGAQVVRAPLVSQADPHRHDAGLLFDALAEVW